MNRISGKLHADSLLKRGRDFIPVAILVTALFALLALSMWFAAYAWTYPAATQFRATAMLPSRAAWWSHFWLAGA